MTSPTNIVEAHFTPETGGRVPTGTLQTNLLSNRNTKIERVGRSFPPPTKERGFHDRLKTMNYYELKLKFDGKNTISIEDARHECEWMNEHYPDSPTKFFVEDCSDRHQLKTGATWEHYSGYNYELIQEKNGIRKKIQDAFKGNFIHFSIDTDKNDNLIYKERGFHDR